MNTQIVAILITEGSKLIGHFIRNRPIRITQEQTPIKSLQTTQDPEPQVELPPARQEVEIQVGEPQPKIKAEEPELKEDSGNGQKATEVATGCVPCAIGHIGTCSGLLNEAMRFANKDGLESTEVIDRVNMCLDELNAMERVDLRPELTAELPEWEKALANEALVTSRNLRHGLEGIKSVDGLESLAAKTQTTRTKIGRGWFKEKLGRMSSEEKEQLHKRVMTRLEDMVSQVPEPSEEEWQNEQAYMESEREE